eukprot:6213412-Pleurochrysis_carterae.AAC.3
MECLCDFTVSRDSIYAPDGFEELYTLIVLCRQGMTGRYVRDKSMACGHTEESMIPSDSA